MPSGNAGRRYAQAIFELAQSQNRLDEWANNLTDIAQTFDQDEVKRYLENPKTAKNQKRAFVENVLGKEISPESLKLALLLVQRERQASIDSIRLEYSRMLNRLRGIEIAEVTTAVPMNEQEQSHIRERLQSMTGKQIQMEMKVDPAIIGGIIARIGDTLIDGSVTSRLQALRKQLA